jgi:hypothetical protein
MTRQRPWRANNPDAVRVDRATKYGNPIRIVPVRKSGPFDLMRDGVGFIGQHTDLEEARRSAARRFGDLVRLGLAVTLDEIRRDLAGHDLACWCPLDHPCHADVLLELANGPSA